LLNISKSIDTVFGTSRYCLHYDDLKEAITEGKRKRLNSRAGVGVAVSVGVAVAGGVSDGSGTERNPSWCGQMIGYPGWDDACGATSFIVAG
jgi:hypothetical protein